jgi:hypothetical protein
MCIYYQFHAIYSIASQIFNMLQAGLGAENEELQKMATIASAHFLAAKKLSSLEWTDDILPFAKTVAAANRKQSEKRTHKKCRCFDFQLAKYLIHWYV